MFDAVPIEANLNPGPRHPNVGEPSTGPNAPSSRESFTNSNPSGMEKYNFEAQNQKLKNIGVKDPDKLTVLERMKLLYPQLFPKE
jgi:hypothetical protein